MSKRGIQYVAQDEPAFIKQFKSNIGYKEGPTIDTKREALPQDESGSDEEDEQPTIVVLKKGDLSKEEYDRIKDTEADAEKETSNDTEKGDDKATSESKIVFKKPTKKTEKSELNVSTKTKTATSSASEKKRTSVKSVTNRKLLSFDDDDE